MLYKFVMASCTQHVSDTDMSGEDDEIDKLGGRRECKRTTITCEVFADDLKLFKKEIGVSCTPMSSPMSIDFRQPRQTFVWMDITSQVHTLTEHEAVCLELK